MQHRSSTCTGLRAGVGQASGEETAAHATVVTGRSGAMAIAVARCVSERGMPTSAVRAAVANTDCERRSSGNLGLDGGEDNYRTWVDARRPGHRRTAGFDECSRWSCGDPLWRRADGGIRGEQPHDQHRPAAVPAHEGGRRRTRLDVGNCLAADAPGCVRWRQE